MIDRHQLLTFLRDEDGVATVDFVIMTAASVATAVSLTDYVRDMVSGLVDEVGIAAAAVNVNTTFADDTQQDGSGG